MGILRLSPDDLPDAGVQPMARALCERRDCRADVVQTGPDPVTAGRRNGSLHRQQQQYDRRRRVVRARGTQ